MKLSTFLPNLHHAYARTDGTYDFPNSREGDMLKTAKTEIEYHLAGIEKLRREIHQAEADHRHACLNLGNAAQVAKSSRLDTLHQAFALVTGTAVNGAHFNDLLSKRLDEPCQQ